MTEQDKQLLLEDLCARLPYGVKIHYSRSTNTQFDEEIDDIMIGINTSIQCVETDEASWLSLERIKPYLRPISSMTEEERLELSMLTNDEFKFYLYTNEPIIMCSGKDYNYLNGLLILDWLNKNMFDYRGLIPKGRAIAVTEENNPYTN